MVARLVQDEVGHMSRRQHSSVVVDRELAQLGGNGALGSFGEMLGKLPDLDLPETCLSLRYRGMSKSYSAIFHTSQLFSRRDTPLSSA